MRIFFAAVVISGFLFSGFANAQKSNAEIRGFLKDKNSGEPILYALVRLNPRGEVVISDANGFFSFTKLPAGNYTLSITSIGFDSLGFDLTLQAKQILQKVFYLNPAIIELNSVVITGEKFFRQTNTNIALTRITPTNIKLMPSLGGEPDLAQYLQNIPGVVSTGDQGGQIYIRGGAPVQNLVLMDGMAIYNPFHSIGLFSVFDSEILKSVDVYTAGFGVEYGGRTSAVIDIKTIDGNAKAHEGMVGVNPFSVKASVNGPLIQSDKGYSLSYLASYRNSYLDQSSKYFYRYAEQNNNDGLPFSFQDIYLKTALNTSNGSKFSIFGFNFNDQAKLGKNALYTWNSTGFGSSFMVLPPGSSSLITGSFAFSDYRINLSEQSALPRNSFLSSFNGGIDFTYFVKSDEIKYGIGFSGNTTNFLGYGAINRENLKTELDAFNTELFGYFKYRYVRPRVVIEPGLRFQYYASLGVFSPEPRIGAKVNLTEDIRLKGFAGMYSQNLISTRSDRDIVNLFNGFLSSIDEVSDANGKSIESSVDRAYHYLIGTEYDFLPNWLLNIEFYVKDFTQVININRERIFKEDPEFIAESGSASGIDFFIRYDDKKKYTAQLGYSLAYTNRSFGDFSYKPHFDRRHNLNILATAKIAKNLDASVRWNLGSGFPFTQTVAFFEDLILSGGINSDYVNENGELGIYYGGNENYNKGRLPWYHRLDISINYSFLNSKKVKGEANFTVANVYNRKNLFYFDRVTYNRVNQLPILPAAGVTFRF